MNPNTSYVIDGWDKNVEVKKGSTHLFTKQSLGAYGV